MTCTPRNASVFRGVFLRRCPLLFAVLDLLVLLDQAKSTRKNLREEKFPDRFFGKIPTFSSGISCKKIFTTFCHQKEAPKVSAGPLRRDRTKAVTERSHKICAVCARSLRAFHPLSDLFPSPVQCGSYGVLRATMIYFDVIPPYSI